MGDPKFTPGPWEARRFKRTGWEVGKVSTAHDQSFGIFIDHAEVHEEADAHLIAAAPKLYEMLSKVKNYMEDAWQEHLGDISYENIDGILAEARGEL